MRSPFRTELFRSIGTTWTRFLAIMGIVGLGVGFYAGLNMTGSDMRLAADTYYDGGNLYDLRVISTLGLDQEQIDLIKAVDGVEDAMGDYSSDAMVAIEDKSYATRVVSFDVEAARAAVVNKNGSKIESDDTSYINRLWLAEGDWPTKKDECLLSADAVMGGEVSVGDTVEIVSSTSTDEVFSVKKYTVTGLAHSSFFPSSVTLGYTRLESGVLSQSMFIMPEAFSDELPYTEAFVTVDGARDLESYSDEYQARVDEVAEKIEGLGLGAIRLEQVKSEAQAKLAEAESEYNEGKSQADKELGDAESQLESARKELEDGEKQYQDGQQQYEEGKEELAEKSAEAEKQLAEARALLEEKNRELAAAEKQLGMTQGDINAAKAEVAAKEKELAAAEKQLGMSQKDIDNARAEVKKKEQEVADGEKQLAQGQKELEAARSQLAAGSAEWESQRSTLQSARNDLLTIKSALDAVNTLVMQEDEPTAAQIVDARKKADAASDAADRLSSLDIDDPEIEAARRRIEADVAQVEAGLQNIDYTQDSESIRKQLRDVIPGPISDANREINAAVSRIDSGIAQGDAEVANASAQVDQAQAEVEAAQRTISEGKAAIADAKSKLDQAQQARKMIDEGKAAIADAKKKLEQAQGARSAIDSGSAQLSAAWNEFYAQEASAKEQLANAQNVLDAAAEKLADVAEKITAGRKEYEEGLKTYNNSRSEVETKLADAASQLEAARGDIDELEEPSIYVLDRTTNAGLMAHKDDTYRIDSIGTVFPFIFFLVAALVSLTTMTRMVEDERIDIGTHKALGFTTSRITAKYVAYAGIAGVIGSVILIVALSQLLPWVLMNAYTIIYNVPCLMLPLPIDIGKSLSAMAIGIGVTFLAIYGAAAATLREVPSALMLPRAPKAGKRILLERIGFIWKRLSFSWKVTCRNLFRYKQRFIMTVVGVMGCTALLLTGFGFYDAIWDILKYQFKGDDAIFRYNTTVSLSDTATSEDVDEIEAVLAKIGGAEGFAKADQENMRVLFDDNAGSSAVFVSVVTDCEPFAGMVDMRERISDRKIEFGPTSVVITEKIASRLGVGPGDSFKIYDQDEIGNPTGDGYELTVTDVCENYVYNSLYVGAEAWKDATGKTCMIDTILTRADPDVEARDAMSDALSSNEAVANYSFIAATIDTFNQRLQAINMIVVVLVAAAGALAFIVLYNLTNIQLIERVREIASLKVLGFNRHEVSSYLFRETIILVLIGGLVGLGAGTILEKFVIVTAEINEVMWVRDIHPSAYLISFGLTILFSLIVMLIIAPKLHKIDMVESLKSVD